MHQSLVILNCKWPEIERYDLELEVFKSSGRCESSIGVHKAFAVVKEWGLFLDQVHEVSYAMT